ncbi:tRNA G18 (ribose-2'-O)-methylase SpoU [Bartonella sp. CDC_skunk]|uniref:tRNA/rRNA methyltransferase protein, TrmH family n=1 Tax=Bartonella rochalimae ATCC BAA-1498 TaxID=685782 RepID=E6YKK0_9HYPH|nr:MULTISPECIES: RNA methyltransferase [Bartonella]AQX18759.1 tRNA G18 (ribose-2'-O)-methylase SpoU [Bartonella sp. A1379B]AQX21762.1 tRNA G18 (ribose-2'-O)-methylase SpoU [Bartonella sp. CDC_skunk]AQX23273.1 tRNA G18 (ribose-2'-O)-methylase SpoU [Bartonella sp. 11B]AQX23425.1 tRNA G18 (ribose-2'-O)-methylase SpoU [Bartonella sp. 114]AQX25729.1 tRNA G18 (ribose-2'-O)-methylase SpoU [Bartonella sp. Coyote22sub2]
MILNITTIHEADDPCLEAYRNIREKDLVGRQHQFIAEGKTILSSLLHSKEFSTLSLLVVAARLLSIMPILKETKPTCPIYCVPQKIMDDIAGFHVHRGMLGIGERKKLPSLKKFLQNLPEKALISVLCGISNYESMGAIFRNAAAFASTGIILDKTSCDPLYRKSIRASSGAALSVPYTRGDDIESIITALSNANFKLYTLSPSATCYLKDAKATKHTALIFGIEGNDLPTHILQKSETLRIPMAYGFDSINLATVSGLTLAHFADFDQLN